MRNTAKFWRVGPRLLGRLQIGTSSGIRSSRGERERVALFNALHFTLKTAILHDGGGESNEAERAVLLLPLRLIFHETPSLPPSRSHYQRVNISRRSVKGGLRRRSMAIAVLGQMEKVLWRSWKESEAVFQGGGNHKGRKQPVSRDCRERAGQTWGGQSKRALNKHTVEAHQGPLQHYCTYKSTFEERVSFGQIESSK